MATGTTIRMVTLLAGFVAVALVTLPRQVPAGQPGMGRHAAGCSDGGCGGCGHGGRGARGDCRLCNHGGAGLLGPRCGHCYGQGCGHWIHRDTIEKRYFLRSQGKSWHSAWYDPADGRPIALVVPPTAEFMTQYSWGVPSSRVMPLYHPFRRPFPGPGAVAGGGGGFLPTPNQPSDTVQFGVNAVRGPWNGY
ncbi:MAG: hypothetical protein FJ284_07370 [Planctomycetes bacterium]|nr:hypothetical protein [Planctomycetota bacterium]